MIQVALGIGLFYLAFAVFSIVWVGIVGVISNIAGGFRK